MTQLRTARCACGQLSVTVRGAPRGTGVCHCLDCQRRTGSVFAALSVFDAPYDVSGTFKIHRRVGDAGSAFLFRFCPECGSTVFHTEEGEDGSVAIAVGCLEDPDVPPPQHSVYECRRHGWVTLPSDTVPHDKDPD